MFFGIYGSIMVFNEFVLLVIIVHLVTVKYVDVFLYAILITGVIFFVRVILFVYR